jgi:hypothetical protein
MIVFIFVIKLYHSLHKEIRAMIMIMEGTKEVDGEEGSEERRRGTGSCNFIRKSYHLQQN